MRGKILSTLEFGALPGLGLDGNPYVRLLSVDKRRPDTVEPSDCRGDCDASGARGKGRIPPLSPVPRRFASFTGEACVSESLGR